MWGWLKELFRKKKTVEPVVRRKVYKVMNRQGVIRTGVQYWTEYDTPNAFAETSQFFSMKFHDGLPVGWHPYGIHVEQEIMFNRKSGMRHIYVQGQSKDFDDWIIIQ